MKKGVLLLSALVVSLIILANISFAQDENIAKAYSCLSGKVKDKCSQLTLEEQVFSLLALSYDSTIQGQCKSALMGNSKDQECWPKSACTLRETALATIALNYIGSGASKPEEWLISKNVTPSELTWYLEIDAQEASTCTIKYDTSNSTATTVYIGADKKLSTSGSASCLSVSTPNYWLQISQSCLDKNFRVSCDKDFITTLLYKKTGSDIWHVSSQTKSSSSGGTTENQVNSKCFKLSGSCDYEGSLWTALALQKNHDVTSYLPYLIALSSDNEKLNPYAFLYILTGSDEYLSSIRSSSKDSNGLWTLSSSYGKYYDTALSLLALQQLNDDQAEAAKTFLLEHEATDGCWQSTRTTADTAFLLYAGWPKIPVSVSPEIDYCEDFEKYCISQVECSDTGGEVLGNYACRENALKICCSKQAIQKTCADKNGVVCETDENCDGDLVSSTDSSNCCQGECKKQVVSTCETNGFSCKSACSTSEETKSGDCPGTDFCCGIKTTTTSYWWIWLLVILIIFLVLAIIFRNRLRLWLFQARNKFRKGPVTQTRPGFPPAPTAGSAQFRPMAQRPVYARPQARPSSRPSSKTDKELEETLKKLREMSK